MIVACGRLAFPMPLPGVGHDGDGPQALANSQSRAMPIASPTTRYATSH